MGILRKLSFWKKSTSSAVKPFAETEDEAKGAKATAAEASQASLLQRSPSEGSINTQCPWDEAPGASQPCKATSSPSSGSPALAAKETLREAANDISESPCFDGADSRSTSKVSPCEPRTPRTVSKSSPDRSEPRAMSKATPVEVEEQPSLLNFDAPLREIYAGIAADFGQEVAALLESTKWDKRSQALKSISAALKGQDLEGMAAPGSTGVLGRAFRFRDRARCWRLSCQLLNHIMRDKVIPVRLAALELYADTFNNTEGVADAAEVKYAAAVLIDHLFDRLGDSNLRLHESARKCILFSAEKKGMLGLGGVLNRLRARLEQAPKAGERTKLHFGVLDAVSVLLEHFPGQRGLDLEDDLQDSQAHTAANSWSVDSVTFFIAAGMDDSLGARVRSSAVALAVAVYRTFGAQSVDPMMKGLRPAKQTLLKQKFKEIDDEANHDFLEDDDDGDEGEERPDLNDLMICGAALKPPALASTMHLPGSLESVGEDECLMDGILEETGMVFSGAGIVNGGIDAGFLSTGSQFFAGQEADFEDNQFLLEQELMGLGLDLDELEEQHALIAELMMMGEAPAGYEMHPASFPVNVCC
eukprot:TRINITY_DN3795_c0_g2_i1.p1 TRINITY_DN3795_c0_g2~~TRINITY_DN3795_c0_g2_i1.p1  ORF type:complete len:588 (-),score=141.87 TRINITY_DN3795_c0_g2_i1:69-1832(-)